MERRGWHKHDSRMPKNTSETCNMSLHTPQWCCVLCLNNTYNLHVNTLKKKLMYSTNEALFMLHDSWWKWRYDHIWHILYFGYIFEIFLLQCHAWRLTSQAAINHEFNCWWQHMSHSPAGKSSAPQGAVCRSLVNLWLSSHVWLTVLTLLTFSLNHPYGLWWWVTFIVTKTHE